MKKERILLLGATGMAGHIVYDYFKDKYEVINVVYRTKLNEDSIILDVTNKNLLRSLILEVKPDIILNCIGVLIKGSLSQPDNAVYINAYLPHLLSNLSTEVGAKLVHISTDCVFSGKKGAYSESDFRDSDDVYGRSKALGEIINDRDLTIRTSIIGPEIKNAGEGLFHWFMNQEGNINGFTETFWGGITTLELAKVIYEALKQGITGVINITNGCKISKFHLLNIFKDVYHKSNIVVNPIEGKHIDKSLISIRLDFDYNVPQYKTMISNLEAYMKLNESRYKEIY